MFVTFHIVKNKRCGNSTITQFSHSYLWPSTVNLLFYDLFNINKSYRDHEWVIMKESAMKCSTSEYRKIIRNNKNELLFLTATNHLDLFHIPAKYHQREFEGNWYTFKGGKSISIVLHSIWKGVYSKRKEFAPKEVYSKRKEFAPKGSKFFPFRADLFSEGPWCARKKQSKIWHPCKNGKKSNYIQSP